MFDMVYLNAHSLPQGKSRAFALTRNTIRMNESPEYTAGLWLPSPG